jgi:hypothetical protein
LSKSLSFAHLLVSSIQRRKSYHPVQFGLLLTGESLSGPQIPFS